MKGRISDKSRLLNSFRNLLAHEYFGLDLELVWGIGTENIADSKIEITNILDQIK